MSLIIEVTDKVITKNVTRKSDGKPFSIPEQECWAHLPGQQYPTRVIRSVGNGNQPLHAGRYTLAPTSFYVDKFGNIAVKGQFDVAPIAAGVSAPKERQAA